MDDHYCNEFAITALDHATRALLYLLRPLMQLLTTASRQKIRTSWDRGEDRVRPAAFRLLEDSAAKIRAGVCANAVYLSQRTTNHRLTDNGK